MEARSLLSVSQSKGRHASDDRPTPSLELCLGLADNGRIRKITLSISLNRASFKHGN